MIQLCSGITSDRVLNGGLYAQRFVSGIINFHLLVCFLILRPHQCLRNTALKECGRFIYVTGKACNQAFHEMAENCSHFIK